MFRKNSSIDNEITEFMDNSLSKNDEEAKVNSEVLATKYMKEKYAKILDHLNVVAGLCDDLGLNVESEAATRLIEVVASGKKGKKKSSKIKKPNKSSKKPFDNGNTTTKIEIVKVKPNSEKEGDNSLKALEELDVDQMIKNLEEKGWVFNADDENDVKFDVEGFDDYEPGDQDDYEPCGDCGFDHGYDHEEASAWHKANPGSYKGIEGHPDNDLMKEEGLDEEDCADLSWIDDLDFEDECEPEEKDNKAPEFFRKNLDY